MTARISSSYSYFYPLFPTQGLTHPMNIHHRNEQIMKAGDSSARPGEQDIQDIKAHTGKEASK